MTHSMTAFASLTGANGDASWTWDMRGVNARGLDIRLRLPDSLAALEQPLRAKLTGGLSRGNINLTLRLDRSASADSLTIDETRLDHVLRALDTVQDRALSMGVTLAQPTAADVLSQRGVIQQGQGDISDEETAALTVALLVDADTLLNAFLTMRASEGAALATILTAQVDQIEALTAQAAAAAKARLPKQQEQLAANIARILGEHREADADRLAQELALITVKSDITEEIDRLSAHVTAARGLLSSDGPKGRKLDFLAQEFNREANTLCSKSLDPDLTAIGLDLKAVIDQMREQTQNVE